MDDMCENVRVRVMNRQSESPVACKGAYRWDYVCVRVGGEVGEYGIGVRPHYLKGVAGCAVARSSHTHSAACIGCARGRKRSI